MRTGSATPDELLAHGGWRIADVQARRSADPETFRLPEPGALARLTTGTMARLVVQIADQADPVVDGLEPYGADGRPNLVVAHERLWVWVESVAGAGRDDELVGVLVNHPVATHSRLVPGTRIRFRRHDVVDLELEPDVAMDDDLAWLARCGFPRLDPDAALAPEDPARAPTIAPGQAEVCARHGVRPERPAPTPFVRCLVGRSLADDVWPVYGARARPQPDRGDCGWSVWAVHPDMEDAADADGFDVMPVTEVRTRHRDVWYYLALPPGWGFVLGPDGTEDVFHDPALLLP